MSRSTGTSRPLQCLIDGHLVLRNETRFQQQPQAQGDIGIFRGIGGGAIERHLVEGDLRLAGARDLLEGNRLVAEMLLGELVHAMAVLAQFKRIGDEHRIVDRRHIDAAAPERLQIILGILADLEDRMDLRADP